VGRSGHHNGFDGLSGGAGQYLGFEAAQAVGFDTDFAVLFAVRGEVVSLLSADSVLPDKLFVFLLRPLNGFKCSSHDLSFLYPLTGLTGFLGLFFILSHFPEGSEKT
jgi:hypothetical protein